jgi:large subunit ribosomal protein L30
MNRIKITQVKSGIDRNETAKRTLIALGLKKLNASVEVEATPQILGMVKRAGHLLKVEELEGAVLPNTQEAGAEQTGAVTEIQPAAGTEAAAL